MFSNGFVSLILALGVAGWVYAKSSRHTGGNKQSALIAAAAVALGTFIVAFTLLAVLFG
jgi:hypothetical protein